MSLTREGAQLLNARILALEALVSLLIAHMPSDVRGSLKAAAEEIASRNGGSDEGRQLSASVTRLVTLPLSPPPSPAGVA